jgi:hypothetical protein
MMTRSQSPLGYREPATGVDARAGDHRVDPPDLLGRRPDRLLGGAGVGQVDDDVVLLPGGDAVEGDRPPAVLGDGLDDSGAEAAGPAGDENGAETHELPPWMDG